MWISLCELADLEDCGCGQRGYNYLVKRSSYNYLLKRSSAERSSDRILSGGSVGGLYTTLTVVLPEADHK